MEPPPPSKASRCAVLLLRVLTFVFLVVSLVILTTNTATSKIQLDVFQLRFKDIYAYRYIIATIVMGVVYILLQIAMTIFQVTGDISHDNLVFNIYGDKAKTAPPTDPLGPLGPPSSMASRLAALVLRFLTFACLLISLVVLTTNTATLVVDLAELKVRFKDVYAYRYMLASIVFGMAYTLLQIAFTLYYVSTGNHLITGDGSFVFDFYGDKVISYVLATGAAAGFGATKDMKSVFSGSSSDIDKFFNKGYASASMILLAFVCTAILSVLSSYALPKKV